MSRAPNQEIGPQIRSVDPTEFIAPKEKPTRGRPRKLTKEQDAELLTWWRQLRALGTLKMKCHSMGISKTSLWNAVERALAQELIDKRASVDPCAR